MAANDDTREELQKQIAGLKDQVTTLTKSLADRASGAVDSADAAYEEAKRGAKRVAGQVREGAYGAVDAARENPAATVTALSTVGFVGLAIGVLIGSMLGDGGRRR
jgi:ElaB/YqjD/DUF883 family membrane-anchored ribosome-binding protein